MNRTCKMPPIIRLNWNDGRFVMSCWHCDYRVDLGSAVTNTEARILIAKHNIREW